jgi:hypothetical protein
MGNLELAGTLKSLSGQRAELHKELARLDKAIAVLRELSTTRGTSSGQFRKRTLSTAARRKIARAQKLRWAKVRQAKAAKNQ